MAATVQITDVDRGFDAFRKEATKRGAFVLVGIIGTKAAAAKKPSRAAQRAAKATKSKPKAVAATIAQIGAWNEYGTKDAGGHTPARSFLGAWFDEKLQENIALARDLAADRLRGKISYVQSLRKLGAYAKGGIQARIAAGIAPGNAASTVRRKKSAKPLIDTGQLRSSIDYRVEMGAGQI